MRGACAKACFELNKVILQWDIIFCCWCKFGYSFDIKLAPYIVLILKLASSTNSCYLLKGRHLKYFIFKLVLERKIATLP